MIFKKFLLEYISFVSQLVKNPLAMRETWVRSLGWEDPLEKEQLPTPVFWPREFHGLHSSWCRKELDMTEQLSLHMLIKRILKRYRHRLFLVCCISFYDFLFLTSRMRTLVFLDKVNSGRTMEH